MTKSTATSVAGRKWVAGAWDKTTGQWVNGHYADEAVDADAIGWQDYLDRRWGSVVTTPADDEYEALLLSSDDRVALEDKVLKENSQLKLDDVEKLSDEELMALDGVPVDERSERISNRLDLEDEVFASYPDLSLVEIQEMDVATLQSLYDTRPATDAPVGGVV